MFRITSPNNIDPQDFQKESTVCNNDEFAHLDESALRSIHDEELDVARAAAVCDCWLGNQMPMDTPHAPAHCPVHGKTHSPWVKRNLDGAQYAQPRGSQYEG